MTPPFDYKNARELQMTPDGFVSGGDMDEGVGAFVVGGAETIEKLKRAGVVSAKDLITRCARPQDREAVAADSGIAASHLFEWALAAELLRVNGITPQFAAMLTAIGAGSIDTLREREADRLADAMLALTAAQSATGLIPSAAVVGGWIEQARRMTPIVTESPVSNRPPPSE